jgi:hypothetical protein
VFDIGLSTFNALILGMAWKPNQNKALDTDMAVFAFYMNIYSQIIVCKL